MKTTIEELSAAYCDGRITPADFELLQQMLKDDAEARDFYRQYMQIDAELKNLAENELAAESNALLAHPQAQPKKIFSWKKLVAIAALLLLLAANLLIISQQEKPQPREIVKTPNDIKKAPLQPKKELMQLASIAQLTQVINAKWSNGQQLSNGSSLYSGLLQLDSGILQLEFLSGAIMVIEGPAKLELISAMKVKCHQGKLHVHVPESAQGFLVDLGETEILDLGTEFALEVSGDKREVHVLKGEIELLRNKQMVQQMKDTKSLKWTLAQNKFVTTPTRQDILSFRQLEQLSDDYHLQRQQEWQAYSKKISEREDVILHYNFSSKKNWQRNMINRAEPGHADGAIIGGRWSEGRWPGKQALEFKRISDRIRLKLPREYEQMSMSCWVRIDSFDRWLSSLLLTDNYNPGELHWQLSDKGEMILGNNSPRGAQNHFSKPIIGPEHLGRWVHLAMVYNTTKKEVVQYLNGAPVYRGKIHSPHKIKLGSCEIGNWHAQDGIQHRIRSWNGRMDEFTIFSSALSDEQINDMYKQGKP